jgi:hypothetical protein
MKRAFFSRVSAMGLALALAAGLLAVSLLTLRAGAVGAAGLGEPAVSYPCTLAGLDSALAAGGTATFACGGPTQVVVPTARNVPHSLTIDGGDKLIITGTASSSLFTVPAGIHFTLLNLTLRNGGTGAINNFGVLNITHAQLISNTEYSVWNEGGASATLSDTTLAGGYSKLGQIINGGFGPTQTATLNLINSSLHNNFAGEGATLDNLNGTAHVSGSTFSYNEAFLGGAIWSAATLVIEDSHFTFNQAVSSIFSGAAAPSGPDLPAGVDVNGGGAIFSTHSANLTILNSTFNNNQSLQGGGAILYGDLPLSGPLTPTAASLLISGSSFAENCTGGPGGAVAAGQKTVIRTTSFRSNFADSSSSPCGPILDRPGVAAGPGLAAGSSFSLPYFLNGAGGAVFNAASLTVDGSTFLDNGTTITQDGGGGAIENYTGGTLKVSNSAFNRNNSYLASGGAIYNGSQASATLVGGDFRGNYGARAGGAVANRGQMTVSYSFFQNNTQDSTSFGGGAIFSGQATNLQQASRNGPAVDAPGQAPSAPQGFATVFISIDHSQFVSNTAVHEGGALDVGPALISTSTFLSNTSPYGGALDVWGGPLTVTASSFIANAAKSNLSLTAQEGGAIDTNGLPIWVINSTFYKNQALGNARGGAINVEAGSPVISSSTFLSNSAALAGQGGALSDSAGTLAGNDIFAFNVNGNCQDSFILDTHSIDYPGSTCGAGALHVDPRALAPSDNGGPTPTSALLAGSPAINAGSAASCPAADQRGAARVGVCDIGAFEFGGIVARLRLPVFSR